MHAVNNKLSNKNKYKLNPRSSTSDACQIIIIKGKKDNVHLMAISVKSF